MGFDSLFFSRLDIKDQIRRRNKKAMEFVWWGNKNLGIIQYIISLKFEN